MKFATAATALAAVLSTLSLTNAAATPVGARDVYDPRVTYPHSGTVWRLGSTHNVTWDARDAPLHISNGAAIYLRKGSRTLTDSPGALASGFNLRTGHHEVTIPSSVVPGTDYRIVLFGDSGNFGPKFTIKK